MSWSGCVEREEMRAVLRRGQWPAGCPAELVRHVESCAACRQEMLISTHLQAERSVAVAGAAPVSSSLLWWRAQARRRETALRQAGRPLAAAQVFALVVMMAAVVGWIAWNWPAVIGLGRGGLSLGQMEAQLGVVPVVAAVALVSTLGGVVALLTIERQP